MPEDIVIDLSPTKDFRDIGPEDPRVDPDQTIGGLRDKVSELVAQIAEKQQALQDFDALGGYKSSDEDRAKERIRLGIPDAQAELEEANEKLEEINLRVTEALPTIWAQREVPNYDKSASQVRYRPDQNDLANSLVLRGVHPGWVDPPSGENTTQELGRLRTVSDLVTARKRQELLVRIDTGKIPSSGWHGDIYGNTGKTPYQHTVEIVESERTSLRRPLHGIDFAKPPHDPNDMTNSRQARHLKESVTDRLNDALVWIDGNNPKKEMGKRGRTAREVLGRFQY